MGDRRPRAQRHGGRAPEYRQRAHQRFIVRLREERLKAGLSQADVAEYLGTTQSAVCDWEKGQVHPGVAFVDAWAGLFGLRLGFVEGDGGQP